MGFKGDPNKVVSPQVGPKGTGTSHFNENHADQKQGNPGMVGRAFNQAQYRNGEFWPSRC